MLSIAHFASSSTRPYVDITFAKIAFACAALVCLLIARPGFASEGADASGSRPIASDDPRTTTMPAMARVDLDRLTRRAPVATTAAQVGGPVGHGATEATKPASTIGTIAEPATIAVLGFTLAALIAVRRRKNAKA